jgi:DNA modification methylase
LLTGIPEQSGTVDYIFIDPPADFTQKDTMASFDMGMETIKADFQLKFKGILRECARILKSGGKVSIVTESAFAVSEFLDYPQEVSLLLREMGFKQVGKVYLPRRSSESSSRSAQGIAEMRGIRVLSSDCRELLTFQKV